MKKPFLIAAIIIASLGMENCEKSPIDPDTELPTYTWKGTLYKGLGEEVWANANLKLIAREQAITGVDYTTVASGTSNESGYFELTYQQFTNQKGRYNTDGSINPNQTIGELTFEANGIVLTMAAWNVSVERDFCSNDHSEVLLRIHLDDPVSEGDSIYINLKPIHSHPSIKPIGNNVQAIVGPLNDAVEFQFKVGITSCFNYCGSKINLMWGKDSIQQNQEYFILKGFPYVDTIDLAF